MEHADRRVKRWVVGRLRKRFDFRSMHLLLLRLRSRWVPFCRANSRLLLCSSIQDIFCQPACILFHFFFTFHVLFLDDYSNLLAILCFFSFSFSYFPLNFHCFGAFFVVVMYVGGFGRLRAVKVKGNKLFK